MTYDWITDEMFNEELENILDSLSATELLAFVPSIYDVLREEFNNDILENICEDRCEECGSTLIYENSHIYYCPKCEGDNND